MVGSVLVVSFGIFIGDVIIVVDGVLINLVIVMVDVFNGYYFGDVILVIW